MFQPVTPPHRPRRFSWRTFGFASALVAAFPFACSKEGDKPSVIEETSSGATTTMGGSGGATGTTGPVQPMMGGGPNIDLDAGQGGFVTNGAGGAGGNCAGEEHDAELVPLDVYVMLDRSLSMNGATSDGSTKWEAITTALGAFVSDAGSEGIGVGIQYFPANKPCTGDDQCDGGLCYLKACENSRNSDPALYGLIPCLRDSDCPQSGDTCVDLGGCGEQSCVVGSICDNDVECVGVAEGVCASQTVCTLSDYTTPEVPMGILPDAAGDLLASLQAYSPAPSPFGLTPTGPALEGAISYASSWAEEHPDRKVIVVLATDGTPTGGCSPSRRAEIAALASVGARATIPVQTYTIGVFSPDDTDGPDNIRAIANAGEGEAFVISEDDDIGAEFVAAMNSVRGQGIACEFQIPESESGNRLDYGKVNVEFTPDAGEDPETILYLDDGAECDDEGGWFYDRDPDTNQPRSIRACDTTCSRLTHSLTGNVAIEVGCETIRKEPIK